MNKDQLDKLENKWAKKCTDSFPEKMGETIFHEFIQPALFEAYEKTQSAKYRYVAVGGPIDGQRGSTRYSIIEAFGTNSLEPQKYERSHLKTSERRWIYIHENLNINDVFDKLINNYNPDNQ